MQRTITSSLSGPSSSSLPDALASKLRKSATKTTDPYMTYGISQALFNTCTQQANYTIPESQRQGLLTGQGPPKTSSGEDLGIPDPPIAPDDSSSSSSWWFHTLFLPPTFSTWSQVSYLHMYILVVRLRAHPDPATVAKYQHYLLDHFSHAAEDKMVLLHGMSARGVRNRYLKDLFLQWRGVLAAYDEGLVKGDAVLGSAVWRNLFKGSEDVDWERVAQVVGFIRASVRLLARVGDGEISRAVRQEGAEGAKGRSGGVFEMARMGLREQVRRESKGMKETPSASDASEPVAAARSA
jgi:cytochrome b pre-mRNA-processing protein 3